MKALIIYYSFGGNTKRIAKMIQNEINADIAEIDTVVPYSGSYNDVVNQGNDEVQSGFMPEIKPISVNIDDYDTLILGTPVWWYTFAPAVKTFLNNYNLKGKTIYPFSTNGGWIGHIFEDINRTCIDSTVKNGLNIKFNESNLVTSQADIEKWIKNIGR